MGLLKAPGRHRWGEAADFDPARRKTDELAESLTVHRRSQDQLRGGATMGKRKMARDKAALRRSGPVMSTSKVHGPTGGRNPSKAIESAHQARGSVPKQMARATRTAG